LQDQAAPFDGVVVADPALLLDRQDLAGLSGAVGDEGAAGIGRRNREGGVVLRQVLLGDIPSISAASPWLSSPRSYRSSNASNRISRTPCSTPPGPSPAPFSSGSKTGQITRYKIRTDHESATPAQVQS
jgi:hypothetical protein